LRLRGARALALVLGVLFTQALAQMPAQAPARNAPPANRWWLGFVDTRGHAFLELPADPRGCAARAALLKRSPLAAGAVASGVAISGAQGVPRPEAQVPAGARLLFGVTDLRGQYAERVLPYSAVIGRDNDSVQGACWYLAEPGARAAGYVAEEDALAFGTLPPRRVTLRTAANDWKSYGAIAPDAKADARFAAMDAAPPAWRARVEKLLPGYTQVYGQRLEAVLEKGGAPQPLLLIGAINDGDGPAGKGEAYNTLNMIVSEREERPLYLAGPSGGVAQNRAGSFVAQAVVAVDLDGDGIDEIVLRARYFTGGNLKVLGLVKGRLAEIRQSAYEGE
jgi:hypothetical protein